MHTVYPFRAPARIHLPFTPRLLYKAYGYKKDQKQDVFHEEDG